MQSWFVYIVKCKDNTLYTGITTDVSARVEDHNHSKKGAKYTRGRRPVTLIYQAEVGSKSEALKEEWRIKGLSRAQKLSLK